MINGAHAILHSNNAEATRAALAKVLGTRSVDAGGGWRIFALPPAELAVHPADEGGRAELYLLCDDVVATVSALQAAGIEVARPISDQGWGLLTAIALPGGVELGLYQLPPPDRRAIQLSALRLGDNPPTKPDTPMQAYGTGFSDSRRRERHLDWSERHTPVNPAGRLLRLVG